VEAYDHCGHRACDQWFYGFIFLLIGLITDNDSFWGLAAGCVGSGVALLIVGMLHRKKAFECT
jgi:hypothetical protein